MAELVKVRHLWRLDPAHRGPQTIQVLNTCHGLAQAGAEVEVFVDPSRSGLGPAAALLADHGLRPHARLRLRRLPGRRPLASAAYRLGSLAPGPDIIYVRHLRHAAEICRLGALRRSMGLMAPRVIVEWHRLHDAGPQAGYQALVWARADAHVFVSPSLRALVSAQLGPPAGSAAVIPNGAPIPPERAAPPRPDHHDGPRVLRCATLLRKAGEASLIGALAAAMPPHWRLEVMGPAHPGLSPATPLGLYTPAQTLRLLATADAILTPFLDSFERRAFDCPLKLWEALAAGRPLITTALPSVCEQLGADGERAVYIPPDDPAALGAALRRLEADPLAAEAMAARALAFARRRTWAHRGEAILELASSLKGAR